MGVADDLIAHETHDPLQAFADDGRAQVADVHFLGDVRSAEVNQHLAPGGNHRSTEANIGCQFVGARAQGRFRQDKIEEAGTRNIRAFQARIVGKMRYDAACHLARIGLGLLGHGHGAIALKIGQIRPVRGVDTASRCFKAFGGEGGACRLAELGFEITGSGKGVRHMGGPEGGTNCTCLLSRPPRHDKENLGGDYFGCSVLET